MALAAATCDKIFAELARKYNLHLHGKKELPENAAVIFSPESQLRENNTEEVDKFHAKIVQLTMGLAQ